MITDMYLDEDGCYVAIIDRKALSEIKTLEDAYNLFNRTLNDEVSDTTDGDSSNQS